VSQEALIVTIFFLVPGFFAVQVFRFLLTEDELSPFELTSWSLIYSVLGILLLGAVPATRGMLGYLYDPSTLSESSLTGIFLQGVASTVVAIIAASVIRRWFGGRLGSSSFYRRSWDFLWGRHGQEERYVLVRTESELLYGVLYFADGATAGRDIILENPYKYDVEQAEFFSDGNKFEFIPGSLIRSVKLSVTRQPTAADKPLPVAGYLAKVADSSTLKRREGNHNE
jgi:hypothetical protein